MGKAIELRQDYDGDELRRLARQSIDGDQTRRLLALAAIYDGGRRTDAAKLGGVTLQIVRDWVLRFNAEGPEGLIPTGECYDPCAQSRIPIDRIAQGRSMSLFQASQHKARMSS